MENGKWHGKKKVNGTGQSALRGERATKTWRKTLRLPYTAAGENEKRRRHTFLAYGAGGKYACWKNGCQPAAGFTFHTTTTAARAAAQNRKGNSTCKNTCTKTATGISGYRAFCWRQNAAENR